MRVRPPGFAGIEASRVVRSVRRALLLGVFAAMLGGAAGCGGGSEDETSGAEESRSGGESSMSSSSTMESSTMESSMMETTGATSMDGAATGGAGDEASVQILGINDFEGNLEPAENDDGETVGGAAYLASALDERAEQNPEGTIRVQVGDIVGASPLISSYFSDEPSIKATNLMDLDMATLGNHEFDEGGEEMLRLIRGGQRDDGQEMKNGKNTSDPDFPGANYPYTSANVLYKDSGENVLPPYRVLEADGVKVGFIGVTTEAAPDVVVPDAVAPFEFRDISDSVNEAAGQLQDEGVEAIVVLSHEGNENEDVDPPTGNLVDEVKQMDDSVDAVVAGNTEFPIDQEIGGIYVVQAAGKSADYSVADLKIDRESGNVTDASGEVVEFDDGELEPDPEVQRLVEQTKEEIAPIASREVGEAAGRITVDPNDSGESPLGDLISDAQRDFADADFAFMNPGGIRTDINEGEVTYENLFAVQPFNNQLVRVEMTGEQIKSLLELQYELEVPTTLQPSGLTYAFDADASEGERVSKITTTDGQPLDPGATYTVAINSFLSTGGDGFETFTEASSPETLGSDLDALVDYIENLEQPFSAPEDNERITPAS